MAGQDDGVTSQSNIDVSATSSIGNIHVSAMSSIGNILSGNAENGQREHAQPHSQDANQYEPGGAGPPNHAEDENGLHFAYPAPTFEQLGQKISSLRIWSPGLILEWETTSELQCIRCGVMSQGVSVSISAGAAAGAATINMGGKFVAGPASESLIATTGQPVHGDLEGGSQRNQDSGNEERVSKVEFSVEGDVLSFPIGILFSRMKKTPVDLSGEVRASYIVLGKFSGSDDIPQELMVSIKKPSLLFWNIFWATVRLRGINWLVSLKDVKGFAVYKCNWKTGVHRRVKMDHQGTNDLHRLLLAYKSWWSPSRIGHGWAVWIHKTINDISENPRIHPDGEALSIEVVLGWSKFRIAVVILLPTLLSLIIGIWFNSRNWSDLSTIQTAWGIASYIATAGGLLAALLGIISGIGSN